MSSSIVGVLIGISKFFGNFLLDFDGFCWLVIDLFSSLVVTYSNGNVLFMTI